MRALRVGNGWRAGRVFAMSLALVALLPALAGAVTSISQGYNSSDEMALGSLVSLKDNSNDEIELSSTTNVNNMLGVVINDGGSLLSVSTEGKNETQVATTGIANVLVSDINGAVKRGDHITASVLDGVGMKASANVRIIGIAQGDMSGTTKQTYKDKSGVEHTVNLGQVPVLVNVAYFFREPEKTVVPAALQNVADTLAGRAVEPLPILLSCAIFIIMLIVVCSLIYSMIRSSIISVGRNPMAQGAVYRNLIQMSGLVIIILGVGVAAIYFILTRL